MIIETIADEQMREFRKNKLNKGKTMNKGLWRLSRHPNYFGEVMFWVGLYLMAILTVETPYLAAGITGIYDNVICFYIMSYDG